MAELFDSLPAAPVLRPFVHYLPSFFSRPVAASDVICGVAVAWVGTVRWFEVKPRYSSSSFCLKRTTTITETYVIKRKRLSGVSPKIERKRQILPRCPVFWNKLLCTIIIKCSPDFLNRRTCAYRVNKVITKMVIRPLDDPKWCAQSVVADLRPLCLGYVGIGMSSFGSPPMYSY